MVSWLPDSVMPRDVQVVCALVWVLLVLCLSLQEFGAVAICSGLLWLVGVVGGAINA